MTDTDSLDFFADSWAHAVDDTPDDACTDCGRPMKGQGQPDPYGYLICPACMATYHEPPAMALRPLGAISRIIAAVLGKL